MSDGGNWKELYQAACDGDLGLVEYHVRKGVDVNYAHPEFLSTPLVACLIEGRGEVALFLLDHGANPHLLSEFDGMTPLQAALAHGQTAVVAKLKALGAA